MSHDCLIVGDCGFQLRKITPYKIISPDMDADSIQVLSVFLLFQRDAVVDISYYLSPSHVLKFDPDDLFYYSSHKIMRRGNHYFVAG